MNANQNKAVDVVARAIAAGSNWEEGTEDYDNAVDLAVVSVQALTEAGLLLVVD
jgi:hypothetical protein